MSEIPDTVKELVRELDPIVGYDVYVCCSNAETCPPELIEMSLSSLYINYGMDHDAVAESPYGDEVARLWEAMDRLAGAPQEIDVVQFEMVEPQQVMPGQGVLWVEIPE